MYCISKTYCDCNLVTQTAMHARLSVSVHLNLEVCFRCEYDAIKLNILSTEVSSFFSLAWSIRPHHTWTNAVVTIAKRL